MYNARYWGVRMKPRIATAVAVIISICCVGATSAMDKTTDLVQSNSRHGMPTMQTRSHRCTPTT